MTAERTHLSIGETLTLLQPEFPDITISKIRFLESQGLLDPERTPSGYRKFHDEDIDRLRWILTQQRDHFLPLKVIKDRLATGDLGGGDAEGVLPLGGNGAEPAQPPAPGRSPAADDGPADSDPAPDTVADESPAPEVSHDADDAAARRSGPETAGADGDQPANEEAAVPTEQTRDEAADAAVTAPEPEVTTEGPTPDGPPTPDEPSPAASSTEPSEPAGERAGRVADLVEGPNRAGTRPPTLGGRRRHPTGHRPGDPDPEPAEGDDALGVPETGLSLSLDELAAAAGVTGREVAELERYGLVIGQSFGGDTYYDEEALVVVRLASGFRRYGIEPRHLRMYKVAAEREAGLFEQLITPLLKQRRPGARQQAVDMLEDLAELADDLRAAMVRTALREYLGGS